MSNLFQGDGNVGQAPVLRTVNVDGETRPVVDLRVYFDRSIKQDDGKYADEGGFWLTVTIWGHRAESAIKLLTKGMRVHVTGRLQMDSWKDDQDQGHEQLRLTADRVAIDPVCLESAQRKQNAQPEGNSQPDYAEEMAAA